MQHPSSERVLESGEILDDLATATAESDVVRTVTAVTTHPSTGSFESLASLDSRHSGQSENLEKLKF